MSTRFNHQKISTGIITLFVLFIVVIFLWIIQPGQKLTSNNTINVKHFNESKFQETDKLKLQVIDPFILKNYSNNEYTITEIIQKDGLYYSDNQISQGGPGGVLTINEMKITDVVSNIGDPSLIKYIGDALHVKINSPKQLEINKSYKIKPGKFGSLKVYTIYKKYQIDIDSKYFLNFKHKDNYDIFIASEVIYKFSQY